MKFKIKLQFVGRLLFASLAAGFPFTPSAQAAPVTVLNHSFEFNNTGNTATDQLGVVPPGPGGQESGNATPAGWTVSGASMDNRWYGTSRFRMAGPTHGVGPGAPGWTGSADVVPSATVLFLRIGNANSAATVGTSFASQNLGTVDDVFGADPTVRLSFDARFGVAWTGDGNEAGEQIDQSFTATITANGVPYATWTSQLGTLAQGRTLLKWGELPGSPAYLGTLPNSNPFNQVFPVDFSQVLSTNMMNLTLDLDKTTIPGGLGGTQLGIRFELTDTGGTAGTAPNATVTIDNVRMDSLINVPPLPLEIISIDYDAGAGTANVTWNSIPGKLYKMEYSSNLSPTWDEAADNIPASAAPATTTSYLYTGIPVNDPRRFFRVTEQ